MLDNVTAHLIVLRALHQVESSPNSGLELSMIPNPDLDSSLESVGLFTREHRLAFRDFVRVRVEDNGHHIQKDRVPIESSTTLQEIVDAVCIYALPGTPTTGDDSV